MAEIIGFLNGVYQACVIGIKEDPFTGTLFSLVMLAFVSSPLLLFAALIKGAQRANSLLSAQEDGQRAVNAAYDAMHAEDMAGLHSRTGRFLMLFLAAILLTCAWITQRGIPFVSPISVALAIPGGIALIVGLRPGTADAPLKFLDRYLPWRGPSYRRLPPDGK